MSLNPLQSTTLPIPIETSWRSNRTNKVSNTPGLFQPQVIETTRRSNRTTLHRKVEDVLSEAPSRAPSRAPSQDPTSSPVQVERKSLASSIFFPKASPVITTGTQTPQTPDYFSSKPVASTATKTEAPSLQLLPQPIETTRRSNRKPAPKALDNETPPPSPPPQVETALTNPPAPATIVPKPFEISRRSNRPLARPLQTVKAEEAPKSNLSRKPDMQLDLSQLPQPVSTSRWTNRINKPGARHLRRSSTVQPPGTPGNYYFVPSTGQASAAPMSRAKATGRWIRPEDHVEHFAGGVDSTPTSPNDSPNQSRCPSLSTSPTSSTDHLPLDSKLWGKRSVGSNGRGDNLEEGYASYILDAQRRKRSGERRPRSPKSPKSPRASGLRQAQNIDDTTSTTIAKLVLVPAPAPEHCQKDSEAPDNTTVGKEKKARGETVKPIKINIPAPPANKVYDEYPIFASPTRESFLPKPERVATKDLPTAKPIPIPNITPNTGNLPTPPDSNPNSSQATMLCFGKLKIPLVGHFYPSSLHNYHHPNQQLTPHNPSPGITVASLPPKREVKAVGSPMVPLKPADVTDQFVGEVWRYLSFEHECIAKRYDEELSEGTGWRRERVTQDRWGALSEYVRMWVGVNPEVDGGERMKGGLW